MGAISRFKANKTGGARQKRRISHKVMVWLTVCSKGMSLIVTFDETTIDHARYIREVFPVGLKSGNDILGIN